jgi:cytochrome c biogenesis protein CcmG, thiol:disulfide interchange protein DsbE
MRRRGLWILAIAAVAAAVVVGLRQSPEASGPAPPKAAHPTAAQVRAMLAGAPPALAALHRQANRILPGERKALQSRLRGLRGHPVLVNVWAAWCGPCRVELPVLQRASLQWGRRVAFVGVDLRDNREAAHRLLRQIPLSYPSYDDPDAEIATGYRLIGTPSTVFYDASGRQTYVHQGPYYGRGELDAQIRRYALGEKTRT